MLVEKYNPNSLSVGAILGLIASGDIAIPEIQRPFVWKKKQVRDLLDSLYKGYPTGYLIIWKNPNVKLKDGSISAGKKILIDGQQRVTALMTAIAGVPVINSDYKNIAEIFKSHHVFKVGVAREGKVCIISASRNKVDVYDVCYGQ